MNRIYRWNTKEFDLIIVTKDKVKVKNNALIFMAMLAIFTFLLFKIVISEQIINHIATLIGSVLIIIMVVWVLIEGVGLSLSINGIWRKGKLISWDEIKETFIEEEISEDGDSAPSIHSLIIELKTGKDVKIAISGSSPSFDAIAGIIEGYKKQYFNNIDKRYRTDCIS